MHDRAVDSSAVCCPCCIIINLPALCVATAEKRAASPSSDEEWPSDVEGHDLDLLLEIVEGVDRSHCLLGIQEGIDAAAARLKHLLDPSRFKQLVQAWLESAATTAAIAATGAGGPSSSSPQPPPADCEPRTLARWRHKCSAAVDAVARAVLRGRLVELQAGIEARRASSAAAAAAEEELAAALAALRQAQAEAEGSGEEDDDDDEEEEESGGGVGDGVELTATAAGDNKQTPGKERASAAGEEVCCCCVCVECVSL